MCDLGLPEALGSVLSSLVLWLGEQHHQCRRGVGCCMGGAEQRIAPVAEQANAEAQSNAAKALGGVCLQASWLLVQLASGSSGARRALVRGVDVAAMAAFMLALAPADPQVAAGRGSRCHSLALARESAVSSELRASSSGLGPPNSCVSSGNSSRVCHTSLAAAAAAAHRKLPSPTPEQQPPCRGDKRQLLPAALLDAVLRNCSWCLLLLCDVAWALPAYTRSQDGDAAGSADPEAAEGSATDVELAIKVGRGLLLQRDFQQQQQEQWPRGAGPGGAEGAPVAALLRLMQSWEGLEASVTAAAVLACLSLLGDVDAELAQRALELLLASPTLGHVCETLCRAGFREGSAPAAPEAAGTDANADAGAQAGADEERDEASLSAASASPPALHRRPLARACALLSQFLSHTLSRPHSAGLLLRQAVAEHAVSWLLHAPTLPLDLRRQVARQLLGAEGHGALSAATTQLVDAPLALCHIISAPTVCHSLLTPDEAGYLLAAGPFGFQEVQLHTEGERPAGAATAAAVAAGVQQVGQQPQLAHVADGEDWVPDAALLGAQALGGPQDQDQEEEGDHFVDAQEVDEDPWVGGGDDGVAAAAGGPAADGGPAVELPQQAVEPGAAAMPGVGVVHVRVPGRAGAGASTAEPPVSTLAVACRLLLASGRLDNAFGAFFSDLRVAGQAALRRRSRHPGAPVVAGCTRRGSLDGRLRELTITSSALHKGMLAAMWSANNSGSGGGGGAAGTGAGAGISAGSFQAFGQAVGFRRAGHWCGAAPGALGAADSDEGSAGHSMLSNGSGDSAASVAAALYGAAAVAGTAATAAEGSSGAERFSGGTGGGGGQELKASGSSAGSSSATLVTGGSGGGGLTDVMAGVAGLIDAMLWCSASLGGGRCLRGGFLDAYDSMSESITSTSQLSQGRGSMDGSLGGSAGVFGGPGALPMLATDAEGLASNDSRSLADWSLAQPGAAAGLAGSTGGSGVAESLQRPAPGLVDQRCAALRGSVPPSFPAALHFVDAGPDAEAAPGAWGTDPRVGSLDEEDGAPTAPLAYLGGSSSHLAGVDDRRGRLGTGSQAASSSDRWGSEPRLHGQEQQQQHLRRLRVIAASAELGQPPGGDHEVDHSLEVDAAACGYEHDGCFEAEEQQLHLQQQQLLRQQRMIWALDSDGMEGDEDEADDTQAGALLAHSAVATWLSLSSPSHHDDALRQRPESMPGTASEAARDPQCAARVDLPLLSLSEDAIHKVAAAAAGGDVEPDADSARALGNIAGWSCGAAGQVLGNPDGGGANDSALLYGGPASTPCPDQKALRAEGASAARTGPAAQSREWHDAGAAAGSSRQGCGAGDGATPEPGSAAEAETSPPGDPERTSDGSSTIGHLPPYTYFGSPQLTAAALAVPVDVATTVTSMLSATGRSSNSAARRIAMAAAAAAAAAATASSAGAAGATTAATTLAASAACAKSASAATAAATNAAGAWPGAAAGEVPWRDGALEPLQRRSKGGEPVSDTQLAVDNGAANGSGITPGDQWGGQMAVGSLQGFFGPADGSGSGAGSGPRHEQAVSWSPLRADAPAPGPSSLWPAAAASAAASASVPCGTPVAFALARPHGFTGDPAAAAAAAPAPAAAEAGVPAAGALPRMSVAGYGSDAPLWVRCGGFGGVGAGAIPGENPSVNPSPSAPRCGAILQPAVVGVGPSQSACSPSAGFWHSAAQLGQPWATGMGIGTEERSTAAAAACRPNTGPMPRLLSTAATAATAAATLRAETTAANSAPLASARLSSYGITGPAAAGKAAVFAFGPQQVAVSSGAFRALRRCSPLLYGWLARVPDQSRPITILRVPGLDDSANHRVFLQLLAWAQGVRDVGLLLLLSQNQHQDQHQGQHRPQGRVAASEPLSDWVASPGSDGPEHTGASGGGPQEQQRQEQEPEQSGEGWVEPLEQLWQLWRAADYLQVDELLTGVEDELARRFTLPPPSGPAAWAAALSLAAAQQHVVGSSSRLAHLCALHFMRSVWGVLAGVGAPSQGAYTASEAEELLVTAGAGAGVLAPAVTAEVRDRLVALVALADQDLSGGPE